MAGTRMYKAGNELFDEEIDHTAVILALKLSKHYKNSLLQAAKYGIADEIGQVLSLVDINFDLWDIDDKEKKSAFFEAVELEYVKLEIEKTQIAFPQILETNIQKLSDAVKLSDIEAKLLKFAVMLSYFEALSSITQLIGQLTTKRLFDFLSIALNEPICDIEEALHREGRLSVSGLLVVESGEMLVERKIKLLSEGFVERMMCKHKNIYAVIRGIVTAVDMGSLEVGDYGHVKDRLDVVSAMLKKQTESAKGGNILIYGTPGTGKTELAKAIAKSIGTNLYEIDYQNSIMQALDADDRLRAFKLSQVLFGNTKNTLLMFDEAEDVFGDRQSKNIFSKSAPQRDKAFINRMLENSSVPTIWLTNSVSAIDEAVLRRFDMVFELPIPPKKKRFEIIKNSSFGMLNDEAANELAKHERLSPAVVAKTMNVVAKIKDEIENPSTAAKMMIEDMLKAQGYDSIESAKANELPGYYDPMLINTDIDLRGLAEGIESAKSARICLYGAPGTGKSAYGRWLSEYLGRPLILKKGSDLLSMWVGGTEKNIKSAFEEANDENAILLLDEVDSFLADRKSAQRNWEVTQVNELLTQMESFGGIFLATTNLMDNLDEASLRRFDAKVKFGYLKAEQALKLFAGCSKELGLRLSPQIKEEVRQLSHLAPGDFAAVMRGHRFNNIKDTREFVKRLQDEVAVKKVANELKMGFLSS